MKHLIIVKFKENIWNREDAASREHFGMMDNPDYCNHACDKIKLYCRHGIIPSVNLILTYETKQCPLNADKVEMILQEYFGCSKWDAVVG